MRPYNVEVFDKNFNFRASALIEGSEFSYKYDYLVRETNTLIVPKYITIRVNEESGSAGDNTVCIGDYIVIRTEDNNAAPYNSAQVIIKTENVENGVRLTYTDPLILFNHMVFVRIDDIKETSICDYIGTLILQEFSLRNPDSKQRIPNIYIESAYTGDRGYFDYTEKGEYYTTINLLSDLIIPAFKNYLIWTKVYIDVAEKKVFVKIYPATTSSRRIEGDLPNIVDSKYIIKQNKDEVNKVTLIDLAEENERYNYYLHPDYTYSSVNTNRITPVKNDIKLINTDTITEEAFWHDQTNALTVINKYAGVNGTLTATQLAELQDAVEVLFPYIKTMLDPTLTNTWYKDNVGFKNICEGSTIHYPLFDFSLYDGIGRQMWATYKDISFDDTEGLEGGSYYTFQVSERTSSIAKTDFEYRTQYKGTLPSDISILPPSDHISRFVLADTATPDEVKSVVTYAEEILWWRKEGKKVCYFQFAGDQVTQTTFTQTVNNNFSHVHLKLPYTVDVRGNIYNADTQDDDINSYYDITGYINIPVTYSWVSNLISAYKQTAAYTDAFEQYKQDQLDYLLEEYVRKNFVAAQYVNNIELTMMRNDSMIKPEEINIGEERYIIHEGKTYHTVLTGKEYLSNGLLKLTFGMIRVDLTKILNLKGV